MKRKWAVSVWLSALAVLSALADDARQTADWPRANVELRCVVSNATAIVVAVSTNQPIISGRHTAHMSTNMGLGDGKAINGGDFVTHATCRQEFELLEPLRGKKPPGRLILEYGFTEKSDAFPGPRTETPVPVGRKVILILGETNTLPKVLPDSAENRKEPEALHQVVG